MKATKTLKTVGLISTLSLTSLNLVSCDSGSDENDQPEAMNQSSLQVGDRIRLIAIEEDGVETEDPQIDIEITSPTELTFTPYKPAPIATYTFEDNSPKKLTINLFTPDSVIEKLNSRLSDPTDPIAIAVTSGDPDKITDALQDHEEELGLPEFDVLSSNNSQIIADFPASFIIEYLNNNSDETISDTIVYQHFTINSHNQFELLSTQERENIGRSTFSHSR